MKSHVALALAVAGLLVLLFAASARAAAPLPRPQMDGYGDPLPKGALARVGTARFRHGDGINALAWVPGGKVLATAGSDGAVRLWDAGSGREVGELLGHKGSLSCVA